LCGLADEQIAAVTDGVALFGSTGAVGSFAEEERRRAAEALVYHVAGRVPVMIGTGAITTAEAIRLSRHADEIGADAILVVPITYGLLTDDEILAHYRAIAGSVRLPLILYNNPRLTGVDLTPPIVEKLAGIENITAIKESCPT
jgi:4-hydroxy-tetrahydrodipicolinate synthase